jgi:predicted ArsR family transcriptional regulator
MSNILMNRTRSQIIRFLLRNGPSTCGQIGTGLRASSSTIRRQLTLLVRAGLVQCSSNQFDASAEQVQRHVEALADSFSAQIMPTVGSSPMN